MCRFPLAEILAHPDPALVYRFSAVEALAQAFETRASVRSTHSTVQVVVAFDNEEAGPALFRLAPPARFGQHSPLCLWPGSTSHQGANSNMFDGLVARLTEAHIGRPPSSSFLSYVPPSKDRVLARSFMLSCDTAHAVHPGWPERHQRAHRPRLGGGVVLKTNAKQSYTSTALTSHVVRRAAEIAGVPIQEFEVRNDVRASSLHA